jgi:hypothetical protein
MPGDFLERGGRQQVSGAGRIAALFPDSTGETPFVMIFMVSS